MKVVQKEIKIYEFYELNEKAKEKVKNWYLNSLESRDFEEICLSEINQFFPKSDLKVQFDLSYCQGDGVNIYGAIDEEDILTICEQLLTPKEMRCLAFYFKSNNNTFELPYNFHHSYCKASEVDFAKLLAVDLRYNYISNINFELLQKVENIIINFVEKICEELESLGYDFFYEIDEKDLDEWCCSNDYYFTNNGNLFFD